MEKDVNSEKSNGQQPIEQTEDLKLRLSQMLGREATVSQLKDGSYFADYFEYGAPAKQFVGTTPEAALEGLYRYLSGKNLPPAA